MMDPQQLMQMLALLQHQGRHRNPDQQQNQTSGSRRDKFVRGNQGGRMYNPKLGRNYANSNSISTGPGIFPPEMPDVGYGPDTPPPSTMGMSPWGAANMAGGVLGGLQGLGQTPQLPAMLAAGGQGQVRRRGKRKKKQQDGGGDSDLLKRMMALFQNAKSLGKQGGPAAAAGGAAMGNMAGGNPMMALMQMLGPYLASQGNK